MARCIQKSKWAPLELIRIDSPSGRKYITPEGNQYTSVTTFLSQFNKESLQQWKVAVGEEYANIVSKRAADRGTRLHEWIENRLKGSDKFDNGDILMLPLQKSLVKPLEHITEVHLLESPLYSDILKLAGTVDCVGVWDNEIAVIDFKTSTNIKNKYEIDNYFLQCSIYSLMVEEKYGVKIDKLVVLIAVEFGQPQIFVEDRKNWIGKLAKMIKENKSAFV